jgi:hypothetical protein
MESEFKNKNLAILPGDIGLQILVRLNDEETELLFVDELLGFTEDEVAVVKASGYYKSLKFALLKSNHTLVDIFAGGHRKRVKRYNLLVERLILRSPERFPSLTAPYSTHKFLLEADSEDEAREPAYYYPIDYPSVEFWNRVHDTERMLTRFKVASLWKRREDRICHEDIPGNLHHVDDTLSAVAFRMEHQFARILLMQNLHFKNVNKE